MNPWAIAAWPVRASLGVLDAIGELRAALHYARWQLEALDAQLEHEAEMLAQEKNGLPGSDGPGGRMPSDGNRESEAHPTR